MKSRLFLASSLALLAAFPALAEAAASGFEPPAGLLEAIDAVAAGREILETHFLDMSGSGQPEALVELGGDCPDGLCDWSLVALTDAGWTEVGVGSAREVGFEETEGGGAVVNSDGVTWAYSGGAGIYPWGDLLQGARSDTASGEDLALIAASSKYTETEKMRVDRYTLDLNGDGADERIFLVGGLYYAAGTWGTPYLIYGSDGALILEGASADMPRIFPMPDGKGVQVIDVVPAGYMVNEIR
ncbi:hypothetical protein [Defluviimonas salinarum]|uniref:Uncharacterized protein n=1 Tax=Defluviimonas salinarum TaxID=2992147 RepID=A0ABT3JAD2_9RHOB|nr:hypothetical protein [Defluviimonas salinarum]MCW3784657.1 hypothetical protein [Defluviimonas salinarum]